MGLKGQPPILEGDLPHDVKPDDCMWNLSDGRLLEVNLVKQDGMRWWSHVLASEPQINTQKVRLCRPTNGFRGRVTSRLGSPEGLGCDVGYAACCTLPFGQGM